MDWTHLLGGKYARPATATSVPKETNGERPATTEAGESKPADKPADTASRRSSGKSGKNPSVKGKP